MHRLGESDDDAFLAQGQIVEEQVKSVDYDVWECDCGEHLVLPYKAIFTSYTACKQCQRRTAKAKRTVLEHATTLSTGRARDAYRCKACEATWEVLVTLPIIVDLERWVRRRRWWWRRGLVVRRVRVDQRGGGGGSY